jgi:indole-3-glycerol phosphate synthase
MLERFKPSVEADIQRLRALDRLPQPYAGPRPSMHDALKSAPVAVIAEYKRASPSKGDINLDLSPEDVARAYVDAGAVAVSVLTEREHFKGELDFIDRMARHVSVPLLRKDFIAHPLQVADTASTRASAMLLIARFAHLVTLTACHTEALALGLEPIVEIFDEQDLAVARALEARLIQVNSRDLDTLAVDPATHDRLIPHKLPGELWIAASGIEDGARIKTLKSAGYDAFLIGTSLMAGDDPGAALKQLITEARS